MFRIIDDLSVEAVGEDLLVLAPSGGRVLRLAGPSAEAFALARSGAAEVPDRLLEPMVGLVELGLVSASGWDRRRLLQLGGAAAAAGVAVLVLPSSAAAASTGPVTPPGPVTPNFRYYRFSPLAVRGPGPVDAVQLSEWELRFGGVRLVPHSPTATDPSGPNFWGEGPQLAADGSLSTKWYDPVTTQQLTYDFGTPRQATSYVWATANDMTQRDPVSWRIDGSNDGVSWTVLDTRIAQPITTARNAYVGSFPLTA